MKKYLSKLYMFCAICEEMHEIEDLILDVRTGLAVCHFCARPVIMDEPDDHTSAES